MILRCSGLSHYLGHTPYFNAVLRYAAAFVAEKIKLQRLLAQGIAERDRNTRVAAFKAEKIRLVRTAERLAYGGEIYCLYEVCFALRIVAEKYVHPR